MSSCVVSASLNVGDRNTIDLASDSFFDSGGRRSFTRAAHLVHRSSLAPDLTPGPSLRRTRPEDCPEDRPEDRMEVRARLPAFWDRGAGFDFPWDRGRGGDGDWKDLSGGHQFLCFWR